MWIVGGKLILDFYNNPEVRLKKRNIEEFCKDAKKRFNISILEVEDFEDVERCVIGFALVVSSTVSETKVKLFVQSVLEELDTIAFARVTAENWELYSQL